MIAAKGCFQALAGSEKAQDLDNWDDMLGFGSEAQFFAYCKTAEVQAVKTHLRGEFNAGVSLGAEWEERQDGQVQVDAHSLLQAGSLSDEDVLGLLSERAFNTLAIVYKTRGRLADFRTFLQKQKIEQVAPKLEDIAGAAAIISKMSEPETTEQQRKELQLLLRKAHTSNRERYDQATTNFAASDIEKSVKKRNQLIDAALRTLASIGAAGFNVEILYRKSNRARRAELVDTSPAIDMVRLDLAVPSYTGFCQVCCGEDEIMAICFKESATEHVENNTTDFALNFPLAAGAFTKNVDLVQARISASSAPCISR